MNINLTVIRMKLKVRFVYHAVGAHVWVFFREGNPNFPVYFAASFGQSDWQGIYEYAK